MAADLTHLIVVGDRVLIRPLSPPNKTGSGLYLPASVKAKEQVQSGIIVQVGPGYPVPSNTEFDEYLKEQKEPVTYIPLQAQAGDQAIYLQTHAHEIEYDNEKFVLVNQASILLLVRDELSQLGL